MKNRTTRRTQKNTQRRNRLSSGNELLESRMMLAGDLAQNIENPMDVNGDGLTTPRDAAMLAWEIATSSGKATSATLRASSASGEPPEAPTAFYDVNGDGALTDDDFDMLVSVLNASGEPGDVITVEIRTTDLQGNTISSIDVGQEYLIQVLVQDTQAEEPADGGFGVFAMFLDVQYNAALTSVNGDFSFGSQYSNQQQGDSSTPGLLNEVGAFSGSLSAIGNEQFELFSIPMLADAPGSLSISTNPADGGISVETLIFGSGDPVDNNDILYGSTTLEIIGEQQETAPDLVQFARDLGDAGVQLFTTNLSTRARIAEQLDLFEEGQHFLPIIEIQEKVDDSDGNPTIIQFTAEAVATGRTRANVWVFPDQSETIGELLTLEEISQRSGVPIPMTATPSIAPIEDVTVLQGSPLHIPLDGYDPNGDDLTYTITVGDDTAVSVFQPTGNRSLRLEADESGTYLGEMVFHLYEGRAPRPTERVITLAEDDFFDGLTFHRVINEFVLQGGDPLGNGTGGSTLPDFDDQYHVDLQHNRSGILSFAKSNDDTNNSQFFVTEPPTRALDFNHSIFGQLIEGERVRETISNVNTTDNDRPNIPVTMENVEVFTDTENSIIMLTALEATGSTTVTVTVSDSSGNSSSETFNVTLEADTINAPPFLEEVEDQVFAPDETPQFQINSIDVDGDPVAYDAAIFGNDDATIEVDENGLVTVGGFIGTVTAIVQVGPESFAGVTTVDPFDTQVFEITIQSDGPDAIDLQAASDTGAADDDNVTNAAELSFLVSGVADGDDVVLRADGVEVGRATATGDSVVIATSTVAEGTVTITAVIDQGGGMLSTPSPELSVTVDRTAPVAITEAAPDTAQVNSTYIFNAAHPEEGAGLNYTTDLEGANITLATGVVQWTPTTAQIGEQTLNIITTDLAGNSTDNPFTVTVEDVGPATIRLSVVDTDGNPISSIATGSMFELLVLVSDSRTQPLGIGQAFVDLTFDGGLATVNENGIAVGTDFPDNVSTGTTSAGQVTGLGGATTTSLGNGEFVLATIPIMADATGMLNLDLEVGTGGVLFVGETTPLEADRLVVEDATIDILEVTTELTAVNDTFTIDEDTTDNVLDVLANDLLGPDSVSLTITSVFPTTANGTLEVSQDGRTVIYTPESDFNGETMFSYTVRDAAGIQASGEVTVTVENVNDPPVANDDLFPDDLPPYDPDIDGPTDPRFFFVEDFTGEIFLNVILNDLEDDPEGEISTISDLGESASGATLRIIPESLNTNVGYTPAANFSGIDTFEYTITDTGTPPLTATATASVRILQRNDAPIAGDDTLSAPRGQAFVISPADLLGNDSAGPLEDNVQTLQVVAASNPGQGTIAFNPDGSLTYTANPDATGTDTIIYTIEDNGVDEVFENNDPNTVVTESRPLQSTGVLTINFVEGNAPPIAFADNLFVVADGNEAILDVLANDNDPNGDQLTITQVTQGDQNGVVSLVNGEISYQPAASFIGTETFTYTISDGEATSTATATVNVTDPTTTTASFFAGSVFLDADNDGSMSAGEQGLGGVVISLTGTADNGQSIELTEVTSIDGSYRFESLPRGSFTITQQQPAFLLDGSDTAGAVSSSAGNDSFTITVGDELVSSDGNMFAERGLEPQYIVLDLLSSNRGGDGFMTLVNGGGSQFVRDVEGWDAFSSIRVSMSADRATVIIRATNSEGMDVEAEVPASDSRVRIIGADGDSVLIRVAAPSSAFNLAPISSSGVSAAGVDAAFAEG